MYDVLIIGAGITGAAIAMELSKYRLKVLWLEKHNDVAMETTKANSGIIHSGYDPKPGTLKARLNVQGARLYQELAPKLNFHYRQTGSLVIGRTEEDLQTIRELYRQGVENGVEGLSVLDREQLHALEPNLREDVRYALHSPTAAIVSPWEACLAFAQTAVHNGVTLHLNSPVTAIAPTRNGYRVTAGEQTYEASFVFNCAGVSADEIYNMLQPSEVERFAIYPVKGQYYLLDKSQGSLVSNVIFQTPGPLGKGVLVAPTVHGNLIVGPDATAANSREDLGVASDNLAYIRKAAALTTGKINFRENIRNFAGLRAKALGCDDFLIGGSDEHPRFINFAGIQSPGLSCGPAFGIVAAEFLRRFGLALQPKPDFAYLPLPTFFKDLTPEQINEKIQQDPRYGRIICRCETVSEGEIVEAIHQTIGATTVDGVKRRTNAGMGRCQGGFCGPKVLEILKRELGCEETRILQDKAGSYIAAARKGGDSHA